MPRSDESKPWYHKIEYKLRNVHPRANGMGVTTSTISLSLKKQKKTTTTTTTHPPPTTATTTKK
jgi:hypothetical protein